MKAESEYLSKTLVNLTVEVESDQANQALEQAYRKVVKRLNVPGFRKGKAPRQIVETYFGPGVLYEDAVEIAIEKTFPQVLEEKEMAPLEQPKFELVQIERDKPLIYKATIHVKPKIELPSYKGLEIEQPEPVEVKPEEVDEILEQQRQRMARLVEVEDAAQAGDMLTLDFTGYLDDQPFDGGSSEDYSLELGSNTLIPGFEEQLIGSRPNEARQVLVPFPAEYQVAELAGKDARFDVLVKTIKRKEFDPLDDEFAKDVSDFETLDELKANIAMRLQEQKDAEQKKALQHQIEDRLLALTEVEAPEPMVKAKTKEMLNQFINAIGYQGISLERYLEVTGKKAEDVLTDIRPQAEKWAQKALLLEAIAAQEGIAVSEDEIKTQVGQLAEMYRLDKERVQENVENIEDLIYEDLLREKTLDFLLAEAKLTAAE